MIKNYKELSIRELHNALVNKEITPLELTKLALEEAKNDNNNAIEYLMEKEALEIAASLTEPEIDNMFWGIPIALKDMEALFKQHFGRKVADECADYKSGGQNEHRCRGACEQRAYDDEEQKTEAQSRARRDAELEYRTQGLDCDDITGRLHAALAVQQQRCGREHDGCNDVAEQCRPVRERDRRFRGAQTDACKQVDKRRHELQNAVGKPVIAEYEHTVEHPDDIFHAEKHKIKYKVEDGQRNDVCRQHGDKCGDGEEDEKLHGVNGEQNGVHLENAGAFDAAAEGEQPVEYGDKQVGGDNRQCTGKIRRAEHRLTANGSRGDHAAAAGVI